MLRTPVLIACWLAAAAAFGPVQAVGSPQAPAAAAAVANGEEFTRAGLQRRPETVALLRELMTARGLPAELGSDAAANSAAR